MIYDKKVPARYRAQLNGRTAEENYNEQKRQIVQEQNRKAAIEEFKRKFEEEVFVAMMVAIDNEAAAFEEDVANNVVNNVCAVFEGGKIQPERLNSFSKQLAIGLGRTLGMMPFWLLDDLFKDDK